MTYNPELSIQLNRDEPIWKTPSNPPGWYKVWNGSTLLCPPLVGSQVIIPQDAVEERVFKLVDAGSDMYYLWPSYDNDTGQYDIAYVAKRSGVSGNIIWETAFDPVNVGFPGQPFHFVSMMIGDASNLYVFRAKNDPTFCNIRQISKTNGSLGWTNDTSPILPPPAWAPTPIDMAQDSNYLYALTTPYAGSVQYVVDKFAKSDGTRNADPGWPYVVVSAVEYPQAITQYGGYLYLVVEDETGPNYFIYLDKIDISSGVRANRYTLVTWVSGSALYYCSGVTADVTGVYVHLWHWPPSSQLELMVKKTDFSGNILWSTLIQSWDTDLNLGVSYYSLGMSVSDKVYVPIAPTWFGVGPSPYPSPISLDMVASLNKTTGVIEGYEKYGRKIKIPQYMSEDRVNARLESTFAGAHVYSVGRGQYQSGAKVIVQKDFQDIKLPSKDPWWVMRDALYVGTEWFLSSPISADSFGLFTIGYRTHANGEIQEVIEKRDSENGSLIWEEYGTDSYLSIIPPWPQDFPLGVFNLVADYSYVYSAGNSDNTKIKIKKRSREDGSILWSTEVTGIGDKYWAGGITQDDDYVYVPYVDYSIAGPTYFGGILKVAKADGSITFDYTGPEYANAWWSCIKYHDGLLYLSIFSSAAPWNIIVADPSNGHVVNNWNTDPGEYPSSLKVDSTGVYACACDSFYTANGYVYKFDFSGVKQWKTLLVISMISTWGFLGSIDVTDDSVYVGGFVGYNLGMSDYYQPYLFVFDKNTGVSILNQGVWGMFGFSIRQMVNGISCLGNSYYSASSIYNWSRMNWWIQKGRPEITSKTLNDFTTTVSIYG